eukprot:SAG31_NODE_18043_length_648_cov_3.836066_1_plen_24_part_10
MISMIISKELQNEFVLERFSIGSD